MTEFKRENRYLVIKQKDMVCLSVFEQQTLCKIARHIEEYRTVVSGRKPLKCVVVESDWPEYEPTWNAIECRVMGLQLCSVCGKPLPPMNASIEAKLDAGYPCPHATENPLRPTPPGPPFPPLCPGDLHVA